MCHLRYFNTIYKYLSLTVFIIIFSFLLSVFSSLACRLLPNLMIVDDPLFLCPDELMAVEGGVAPRDALPVHRPRWCRSPVPSCCFATYPYPHTRLPSLFSLFTYSSTQDHPAFIPDTTHISLHPPATSADSVVTLPVLSALVIRVLRSIVGVQNRLNTPPPTDCTTSTSSGRRKEKTSF